MARFKELREQAKALSGMDRHDGPPLSDAQLAMARALLIPALYVAQADGRIDQSEIGAIARMCRNEPLIVQVGSHGAQFFQRIQDEIAESDAQDMVDEVVATLSADQQRRALVFALRVAMADGMFDIDESSTAGAFARNFGISGDRFAELVDEVRRDHPYI